MKFPNSSPGPRQVDAVARAAIVFALVIAFSLCVISYLLTIDRNSWALGAATGIMLFATIEFSLVILADDEKTK